MLGRGGGEAGAPSTTHPRCAVPLPRCAGEEHGGLSVMGTANTHVAVLLHRVSGGGGPAAGWWRGRPTSGVNQPSRLELDRAPAGGWVGLAHLHRVGELEDDVRPALRHEVGGKLHVEVLAGAAGDF